MSHTQREMPMNGWTSMKFAWAAVGSCAALMLLAACAAQSSGDAVKAVAVPSGAPSIDPQADRLLRAASKYLAEAKSFSFKAEIWEDQVLPNGQKIQTTKDLAIQEKRPGGLRVDVRSPRRSRGFWYHDKTLTVLDRASNFYGVVDVPGDIDGAIDFVEDRFGIEIPLADLLASDAYTSLMERAQTGDDLGNVFVLGVKCNHLAFTGPEVDWQIWIQDGPEPLPRKLVINYKTKVGSPQYTAIISDWNTRAVFPDSTFTFVPAEGASRIDVVPRKLAAGTSPTDSK